MYCNTNVNLSTFNTTLINTISTFSTFSLKQACQRLDNLLCVASFPKFCKYNWITFRHQHLSLRPRLLQPLILELTCHVSVLDAFPAPSGLAQSL